MPPPPGVSSARRRSSVSRRFCSTLICPLTTRLKSRTTAASSFGSPLYLFTRRRNSSSSRTIMFVVRSVFHCCFGVRNVRSSSPPSQRLVTALPRRRPTRAHQADRDRVCDRQAIRGGRRAAQGGAGPWSSGESVMTNAPGASEAKTSGNGEVSPTFRRLKVNDNGQLLCLARASVSRSPFSREIFRHFSR